jgi:hypothetical protein
MSQTNRAATIRNHTIIHAQLISPKLFSPDKLHYLLYMLAHLPTISLIGTHYKQKLPSANIGKKQHTLTATPSHPGTGAVHAYNLHTHTQRLAMQALSFLTQITHISLDSAFGPFASKGMYKGPDCTITQAQHIQKYPYADQPLCPLLAVCHTFVAYAPGGLTPVALHPALGNTADLQVTDRAANDCRMDISIWPITIGATAFKFQAGADRRKDIVNHF